LSANRISDPPNKRITLTRPSAAVSCDRSTRRLSAQCWARPGAAAWPGLSSVAPVWDDESDGRVPGGSMKESSTMYAVVADVHGEGLREVMKDYR
jgi:hypothetical protein